MNVAQRASVRRFVGSSASHGRDGEGFEHEAQGDECVRRNAEDNEVEDAKSNHLEDGGSADRDSEGREADFASSAALSALICGLNTPLVEATLVDVSGRASAVAWLEKVFVFVAVEADSTNDFVIFFLRSWLLLRRIGGFMV